MWGLRIWYIQTNYYSFQNIDSFIKTFLGSGTNNALKKINKKSLKLGDTKSRACLRQLMNKGDYTEYPLKIPPSLRGCLDLVETELYNSVSITHNSPIFGWYWEHEGNWGLIQSVMLLIKTLFTLKILLCFYALTHVRKILYHA